ncbi:PIG-L family deacetylase [Halomonas denitrificans]|uniref:PIG-L deacetylase family protein n=1 Tax=Halomonas denitrificans TaxID=370769 RepID=UPI001CD485CA|nr:PIG-L family deacetylase [Halomonas denitrificans]MCA0976705.1 PIG-L family deacetylase [Halomonas denitrificans]
MPHQRDHQLPLTPDWGYTATIDSDGHLKVDSTGRQTQQGLPNISSTTWMLEVSYRAESRWKLPAVTTHQAGTARFTQYLEPKEAGRRLINLTGISSLEDIRLDLLHLRIDAQARLLGFKQPDLDSGPILIIAPHPDDAELAAFGLYTQHPDNTWIVTLTPGERLKKLDKQYWPNMDESLEEASRRKGFIRTWNSATTPLLAGVPAQQLVMLGYFNDTLAALYADPDEPQLSHSAGDVTPDTFRQWNHLALPSDGQATNTGHCLQQDLMALLNQIKPTTVVTPHPELDPHTDHIAATEHLLAAMRESEHSPETMLLYANHLKSTRGFPRGPAHAAAGVWPTQMATSRLGEWRLMSTRLDLETQKQKALALHSMHDLGGKPGLERRWKRRLMRWLSGVSTQQWKEYGGHDYFQSHVKAHEVFCSIQLK